jgi:hypothetical protein
VYFLQPPETHAFDLYHDYTESRVGVGTYINEVRAGSTVSNPRAKNLDTGEDLKWEILKGSAITAAKLDVANVTPQSEIVVFRFLAGEAGRVGTHSDVRDVHGHRSIQGRWQRVDLGSELWPTDERCGVTCGLGADEQLPFRRPVSTIADGRVRLDFVNPRPDEIAVSSRPESDRNVAANGDVLAITDRMRCPNQARLSRTCVLQ